MFHGEYGSQPKTESFIGRTNLCHQRQNGPIETAFIQLRFQVHRKLVYGRAHSLVDDCEISLQPNDAVYLVHISDHLPHGLNVGTLPRGIQLIEKKVGCPRTDGEQRPDVARL